MSKNNAKDFTAKGVHANMNSWGAELMDHIMGKATIALLKQGKPVTVETLRTFLNAETEYQASFYAAAHEFLASLPKQE